MTTRAPPATVEAYEGPAEKSTSSGAVRGTKGFRMALKAAMMTRILQTAAVLNGGYNDET
jgi:hypothetical protein